MYSAPKCRPQSRYIRLTTAIALVAMAGECAASHVAFAQDNTQAAPQSPDKTQTTAAKPAEKAQAKPAESKADSTVVVITGTRSSQRSAIDRKKHAKTATDSIIAEDIGSFPDRNIGEAISRVPGIQLDRGDFGEGVSVNVRNGSPETTRVELDGVGAMSTGGGLGGSGGSTRGTEFRELPSDLVKSVDVVKGSLPSTTEGSLGGSISIQTRTGLDFKKPYLSFRYDETMNTVGKKWTPEWNLIMARKFLGGRLGVLANITYSEIQTNSDSQQATTSGQAGYYRSADFDQSANKTFTYNPSTVDPTATYANVVVPGWSSASPIDIIKESAAATTQAQCLADFSPLTSAQLAKITAGSYVLSNGTPVTATASQNRTYAQAERTNELQSCLTQWNDYAPSLIRFISKESDERRLSYQLRADYRVNDDLTVYINGNVNNRTQNNIDNTLNLGSPSYNVSGTYTQGTVASTTNALLVARTANSGYGFYSNGLCTQTAATTGCGVVSDITNAVVDSSHHLTSFTLNDGNINIDAIHYHTLINTYYLSTGGTYNHGPVKLSFLASQSGSDSRRGQVRTAINYTYGSVNLHVTPAGLWTYDMPSGLNFYNPANYTSVTNGVGTTYSVTYRPYIADDQERQIKTDLTYDFEGKIPFLTDIQGGLQSRMHNGVGWGYGGYTPSSGVTVPSNAITTTYYACSTCTTYGYTATAGTLGGVTKFTQAQLQSIIAQALYTKKTAFMGDYSGKGDVLSYYPEIDPDVIAAAVGTPNFNYSCMKVCMGSDGKMYAQPKSEYVERANALYYMFDFEKKLPWRMVLNGNFGERLVTTTVNGTGNMTFIHKDVLGNSATYVVSSSLSGKSTDWMPSYNVNLWAIPDKLVLRYYSGHVTARPPAGDLLPSGSCTIDDSLVGTSDEDIDQSCTGRVGNPNLKPYKAINHNESLEWYINKDNSLSLAYFYNNVLTGAPVYGTLANNYLFAGSNVVDPVTGLTLSQTQFTVPTYVNAPGGLQRGIEFSAKMAFTWAPWRLRYTGLDFNYSKNGVGKNYQGYKDVLSGESLDPQYIAGYFENISLWYDDGRLNARIAYQGRDKYFDYYSSCSNAINNIPANYPTSCTETVRTPYNPGAASYREKTQFVDVKINYKLNRSLEFFAEGRNVLRAQTSAEYQPGYGFSDGTPSIGYVNYAGARFTMGLTYRQ